MFSPEEELKGSEVPSWEWCREWLPDVGKLQRGGAGEGRATTPDALMEQGLVWCCGKKSRLGERLGIAKFPLCSPEPWPKGRSGLAGAGWGGFG